MTLNYVQIGEHIFKIESKSCFLVKVLQHHFLDAASLDSSLPVHMKIGLESGYGVPFLNYEVTVDEKPNIITFQRADYLIEVNPDYSQAKISIYDELALKHALMTLYSSFIVHHNWGLLIHSSCVIDNGSAHIFSGNSGAGKSTAATLSLPRQLLSDEATILKITEDNITVYNSPFRSELKAVGNEQTTILKSIDLLYQGLTNKRALLKKREALLGLLDKVFYWSYKQDEIVKIIHLLKLLVDGVPVNQLYFKKDNTFWELISNDKIYSQTEY